MLTEPQKRVLTFLVNLFNNNGIVFQASGGLAAIGYGVQRPLQDIDLEIYKKDVEKVRELLMPHIVEDWNNDLIPNDQFDMWMMTLEIDGVPIDINQIEGSAIISADGRRVLQPEVMKVHMGEIEGISVPLQNKEVLIAYKKILDRDVDREDIRQLS